MRSNLYYLRKFSFYPRTDELEYSKMRNEDIILHELILRLKKLRQFYKITQKKLSRDSGISYATIRHFERTGNISLRTFLKIINTVDTLESLEKVFIHGHTMSSLPEMYFKKRYKSEKDLELLDL